MPSGSLSTSGVSCSSFSSWVSSIRSPGHTAQHHSAVRVDVCMDDQFYFKTWLLICIVLSIKSLNCGSNLMPISILYTCKSALSNHVTKLYSSWERFLETLSCKEFKYLKNTEKEWTIRTPSLNYIREWAEQINITTSSPEHIVCISNHQDWSLTVHQFLNSLLQGPQPRIRSYGQKPYVMTRC